MAVIHYRTIDGHGPGFLALMALLGALIAAALGAAWYMEHNGHYDTGMSNQIVWGAPHVFAVFLIVAASGAAITGAAFVGSCLTDSGFTDSNFTDSGFTDSGFAISTLGGSGLAASGLGRAGGVGG